MSGHEGHDNHDHHTMMANATAQMTTLVAQALANAVSPTPDPMGHAHHDHKNHGATTASMDEVDHSQHGVGAHMMMMMYFRTGVTETILFKEWAVDSVGGMVGAVIGVLLLALLYEGLKFLREQLYRHQYTRLSYSTCAVTGNNVAGPTELHKITESRILSWPHLLQTSLHVTQVLLSYFLMLIFMTFNVWLCLGVLAGSGIGYFLFGWRKATIVDISDHCH